MKSKILISVEFADDCVFDYAKMTTAELLIKRIRETFELHPDYRTFLKIDTLKGAIISGEEVI